MAETDALATVRVKGELRRQSAALPLTGIGTEMRIVLVTSRETRRWVIPKGWVERGELPHQSAEREAFEEAGLVGQADPTPLGHFAYNKRKSGGVLLPCDVLVFRLSVTRMLNDWPEREERVRRLFTPQAAANLVAEPDLSALLRSLQPTP